MRISCRIVALNEQCSSCYGCNVLQMPNAHKHTMTEHISMAKIGNKHCCYKWNHKIDGFDTCILMPCKCKIVYTHRDGKRKLINLWHRKRNCIVYVSAFSVSVTFKLSAKFICYEKNNKEITFGAHTENGVQARVHWYRVFHWIRTNSIWLSRATNTKVVNDWNFKYTLQQMEN